MVSWCLFVFVVLLGVLFSVVVNSVGYFTLLIDVVFVLLYCLFTLLLVVICCYCLLRLAAWFGGAA